MAAAKKGIHMHPKTWTHCLLVLLGLFVGTESWAAPGDYCTERDVVIFSPTIKSLGNPQKFTIDVTVRTFLTHRENETASCVFTDYPIFDLNNGLTLKSKLVSTQALLCKQTSTTGFNGKSTVTTFTVDKESATPDDGKIGCYIELSYEWQIEGTRDESNGNQQITMQLGNLELEEHQPNGGPETVLNLPSNSIFWMPPVMRCTSTPDKLITVDLGKIPASKFAKVGDASSAVDFTMRWIGCYDKTTQHQLYDANLKLHTVDYPAYAMSMQMDFTPMADNNALMANTIEKDKGGTTGLALELIDKTTQTAISNGVPFDLESAYTTGSTARTFSARLKSTEAKVTPGQFKSIATYTVTYK